ncbi:MAG: ABC transporter ATP-binding protein [Clostridia bacterium]|nr:ABC transporter ATP-binding protein [Clostridia bacterium]
MTEPTYTESSLLLCHHLCKSYTSPLIEDLFLSLPAGKIVGLLGPNGSGKTTLIKMIAGILRPTSGDIRILGNEPSAESKAMVAYLPERNALPESMRVDEVIKFFSDMFSDFDASRACEMLADLAVPMDRKIRHLSKGMKEKVQLITVMCRRAALYLLDEPIGGVDPATRDYVLRTIIGSHSPNSTILISTHLIADVEPALDHFLFMKDGKIVLSGETKPYCEEQGASLDEIFRRMFRC